MREPVIIVITPTETNENFINNPNIKLVQTKVLIETPKISENIKSIIQNNDGVDNILILKTGGDHNILIFKNGKVYVWGYNRYCQLGLGDTNDRNTPTENTILEQIIQDNGGADNILTLETSWGHNILIFKNGKVYVWGWNNIGQLGIGDWDDRGTPTENTILEQIIQQNGGVDNILTLETGWGHNILIFKNGKVYVWGANDNGQLGIGYASRTSPYEIPTKKYGLLTPIENFKIEQIIQDNGGANNILTLKTGEDYNILIFKNGKVYVWGYNYFGQLGLGYKSSSSPYGILTPTENTQLEQIIQNNGGVDNILTLETGWGHNILIFKNGKVYVWGINSAGQLGLGDTNDRNTPTENTQLEQIIQDNGGVENIHIYETGSYHNILVFKNGKVYVWGNNYYGQIGIGDTNSRNTPTENSNLEQVIQDNGGVFLGGGSSVV